MKKIRAGRGCVENVAHLVANPSTQTKPVEVKTPCPNNIINGAKQYNAKELENMLDDVFRKVFGDLY